MAEANSRLHIWEGKARKIYQSVHSHYDKGELGEEHVLNPKTTQKSHKLQYVVLSLVLYAPSRSKMQGIINETKILF